MLYHLLYSLRGTYSALNVLRYITFRTLCAAILSFLIAFLFGPYLIRKLTELQVGQQIRADGPVSHQTKAGTPTMGGTLILLSLVLSTMLLGDLTNAYVWLVVGVTVSFGAVGFVDDWRKLIKKRSLGLSGREKLVAQFALALTAGLLLLWKNGFDSTMTMPFLKNVRPDLGWFYPCVRGAGDRRHIKRRQSDGRPRRARDRARDDRRHGLHDVLLRRR